MNANECERMRTKWKWPLFSCCVVKLQFYYLHHCTELRYTGDAKATVASANDGTAKTENCGVPFEEEWYESDRLCRRMSVGFSFPVMHSSTSRPQLTWIRLHSFCCYSVFTVQMWAQICLVASNACAFVIAVVFWVPFFAADVRATSCEQTCTCKCCHRNSFDGVLLCSPVSVSQPKRSLVEGGQNCLTQLFGVIRKVKIE